MNTTSKEDEQNLEPGQETTPSKTEDGQDEERQDISNMGMSSTRKVLLAGIMSMTTLLAVRSNRERRPQGVGKLTMSRMLLSVRLYSTYPTWLGISRRRNWQFNG